MAQPWTEDEEDEEDAIVLARPNLDGVRLASPHRSSESLRRRYLYLRGLCQDDVRQTALDIPQETLREAVQRQRAKPRDLTGAIFGDPPVGFSALDKYEAKHAQQTRPTFQIRRTAPHDADGGE